MQNNEYTIIVDQYSVYSSTTNGFDKTQFSYYKRLAQPVSEVYSHNIAGLIVLCGTSENPVQIDESYFGGRRKFHRGRMLQRDDNRDDSESESDTGSTSTDDTSGPWVLGMCTISKI